MTGTGAGALPGLLAGCRDLLLGVGEADWSSRAAHAVETSHRQPDRLRSEVAAWFGGTGSLNDLVLSPLNGHRLDDTEVAAANLRLDSLRTAIWRELQSVRTEMGG